MLSIVIHSVGTVSYRSALKRVPLVPSPSGGRQHYFLPSLLSLSLSLSHSLFLNPYPTLSSVILHFSFLLSKV